MGLVLDRRQQVPGAGVHALICGVSEYQHLPPHDDIPRIDSWRLNKLTSAALSAFRVYEAIVGTGLRLPLKTVRLLLSPSLMELAAVPAIGQANASPATRLEFERSAREWRQDASANRDDVTFFYFAGHGMQRGPEDGVMLLQDFHEKPLPPLARAFEIANIRNGMAPTPSFPNIAMEQFYFIDACLTHEETEKKYVDPKVPEVFGIELPNADRRAAPLMFSTLDGTVSLGRNNAQPSYFAEGLIRALARASDDSFEDDNGVPQWPVTALSIMTSINAYYAKKKAGTDVKLGGVAGTAVLRYLQGPPDVDAVLDVKPSNLGGGCGVWLFDENDSAVPKCDPNRNTNIEVTVKAGIYYVKVESTELRNNPYRSKLKYVSQRFQWPWRHNLTNDLKYEPSGGPMKKPKVATLKVTLDTPEGKRWAGSLPIEVRDCDNMTLQARGSSDSILDLPEGRYLVTATLPSGGGATAEEIVTLKAGDVGTVRLSVESIDVPAMLDQKTSMSDSLRELVRPVTKFFASHTIAIFEGDPLRAKLDAESVPRRPTAHTSIQFPFAPGKSWIEIAGSETCTYLAVPVDEAKSTTVKTTQDASGQLQLTFDFHDGDTNSFFDFIQNSRAFEARSISRSILLKSEDYMMDKKESPLRAIMGAYVLLRANELEDMDRWTSFLMARCPNSGDALTVRMEFLARQGRHQEAASLLLDAARWGTPLFRSGIGYLESRAKLYLSVAKSGQSSLSIEPRQERYLSRLGSVLQEFATSLDMAHYTTVLRNIERI